MQDRRRLVEQLGAFFMNMFATFLKPMHPEGYRFVAIFAAIAAALFWLWPPLGWIGIGLTIWCYYFFRDRGTGDSGLSVDCPIIRCLIVY